MQSEVKEHAELFVLLGMITPVGWLERSPSYKEIRENITDRDLALYGFLGYPVLQTADVVIYKANRVPVGVDQVPHIELAREIVRRFNLPYGEVFPEPQPLLTSAPKILGTDGRKMSKSYGNTVDLGEDGETTRKKIMGAVTDPPRKRRQDPGDPEVCGIFYLHKVHQRARHRRLGGPELPDRPGSAASTARRSSWSGSCPSRRGSASGARRCWPGPRTWTTSSSSGRSKARTVAQRTMEQVRQAMKLTLG